MIPITEWWQSVVEVVLMEISSYKRNPEEQGGDFD
jgi:hypothetical protein